MSLPGTVPGLDVPGSLNLTLGDACLGLPRLPEVPAQPGHDEAKEEEAVCCICLQAELDPLAWRSSAPHAASPSPSHDVHSFQRPLSGLVGQPTAEDAQLVSPCDCKGSSALRHVGCLRLWHAQLNHPSHPSCSTCLCRYSGVAALALAHDNRCKLMTDAHDEKDAIVVGNTHALDESARRRRLAEAQVTITRALMDAGELDEAMRMATSTLAITWNSEKAGVLELLAGVHSRRAEPAVAVQFMQRAHSIRVRCLGSKHHETAMSLSRTGSALLAAGSPAEARKLTKKAVRMIERCKDSSEAAAVHLAASLNNLANVLRSQRDDEKAELLYWRALRTYEMMEMRTRPRALQVLNNLALSLMDQRRLVEAAECSAECLAAASPLRSGGDYCLFLGTRGTLRKAAGELAAGDADLDAALQGLRVLAFSERHEWCVLFAAKRRQTALDELLPPPPPGSLTGRRRWLGGLTLGCASLSAVKVF